MESICCGCMVKWTGVFLLFCYVFNTKNYQLCIQYNWSVDFVSSVTGMLSLYTNKVTIILKLSN